MTAKGTPSAQDGYKAHCKGMAEVERRNQMTKPEASPAGGARKSVEELLLVFVASLQETGHSMDEIRAGLRALVPQAPPTEAMVVQIAERIGEENPHWLHHLGAGWIYLIVRAALTAAAGEKDGDPIRDAEARGYRQGVADAKGRG